MTRQEKIRYLSRYKNLDREIYQKREQIIKWRSEAEKVTTILSDMPKAKSKEIQDKNAEVVAKILDLTMDMKNDLLRLVDLKREIEAVIDTVEDPVQRLVLEKRYIDCKRWEKIMKELNYSYSHLDRIHRQAINLLEIKR